MIILIDRTCKYMYTVLVVSLVAESKPRAVLLVLGCGMSLAIYNKCTELLNPDSRQQSHIPFGKGEVGAEHTCHQSTLP